MNNTIKKNVLCLSVMENWGGGEEFLLHLNHNVKDFHCIIVTPEGETSKKFQENEVDYIILNSIKKIYRKENQWKFSEKLFLCWNIFCSIPQLLWIIYSRNISCILLNGNFAGLFGIIPGILSRKKILSIQHLIYEKKSPDIKFLSIINHFAHQCVCVSHAVLENISVLLRKKFRPSKYTVIHNGISLPPKKSQKKYYTIVRIGIIGSIIRTKGIDIIIECVGKIKKNNPELSLEVLLFGNVRDSEDSRKYQRELKNQIQFGNLENIVHWQGYADSKEKMYSNVDIVVNYSQVPESFSLVVAEAMVHKKIVIAANIGGPKEIITNKQNGFLVEPNNPQLLQNILEYCIQNIYSAEFEKIREYAYTTIKNNFSIEQFALNYNKLFHQLINFLK